MNTFILKEWVMDFLVNQHDINLNFLACDIGMSIRMGSEFLVVGNSHVNSNNTVSNNFLPTGYAFVKGSILGFEDSDHKCVTLSRYYNSMRPFYRDAFKVGSVSDITRIITDIISQLTDEELKSFSNELSVVFPKKASELLAGLEYQSIDAATLPASNQIITARRI